MSIQITQAELEDAKEEDGGWCLDCEHYATDIPTDEENAECEDCGEDRMCGWRHLQDAGQLEIVDEPTVGPNDTGDFEDLNLDDA